MGVKTVQLTEARGQLAGARVVRDGYQVMLISTGGTMIKIPVEDVKRLGRATQGVIVMRLRKDEIVSSLAPVVDSDETGSALESDLDVPTDGTHTDPSALEPNDLDDDDLADAPSDEPDTDDE
jgi:DNA gyrase subunit A